MASAITIWTFDWVPEMPRGFVRDLRLRWACEEAGFDYVVRTVAADGPEPAHLARQPFGQVPFLDDGDLRMFESGAALLHLARKSEALMPRDPQGEAEVTQWIVAALNSIEMVSIPYWYLGVTGGEPASLKPWLEKRLGQLEAVLQKRDWLAADRFTAADLLMADVLRLEEVRALGDRPATNAFVDRILSRPGFMKAEADQLAHFEAAEQARKEESHG
ncbi:MAG: glutathione S-transferase [Citromicrobium sp.]|nr:glutathione S-transferase [Citromicrobium sp.]